METLNKKPPEFRPCGPCTACCSGQLVGQAFGNFFGHGKPCVFLHENKCGIYNDRPPVCRKYQCAWSQGLLPEDLRPDKCGLMVSVVTQKDGQHFQIIEIDSNISFDYYKRVEDHLKSFGVKIERIPYHHGNNNNT
jgi:Fe-S-cluster containining protein